MYFCSPPDAGGVRGGMSEGKNLKKKLIRLIYTPPNLPYARGGIKRLYFVNVPASAQSQKAYGVR